MNMDDTLRALCAAHDLASISIGINTLECGRQFFTVYPQRVTPEGRASSQGIGDTIEAALAEALPNIRVLEDVE